MLKRTGFLFILCLLLLSSPGFSEGEKVFPMADKPARKIFLGEKMTFHVSYLGIVVGDAECEVKEIVKIGDRDAYRIEVSARSRPILDWIYKVRDTHQTFIDVEKLYSLRYEKKIHEGRYWTDEVMEYDQDKHLGVFYSKKDNSSKEMFIPKNVQDQISCGYYYRTLDIKPGTKVSIPVNADEKNWDLEVSAREIEEKEIDGVGIFQAIKAEPVIMFEGFFVRRGKVRGWMSLDERRIPLIMKVKVPVLGDVVATLAKYDPGQEPLN